MAIKPPDLLHRLPSVSELLEKPPIRALVDRWNRSVVAGRVQSFLDELRVDLRRRAAEVSVPGVRDLAERAARYVMSQQQASLGIAVNATGQLWGTTWTSMPVPDSGLERMVAVGREFMPASRWITTTNDISTSLCRLTGAEAAVAVHSYSGALWLALSSLAAGRDVLLARGEIGDVALGGDLTKLAAAANVALQEVGTTNRATAADFEAAATPRTAAILKVSAESYRVIGDTATTQLEEMVALARDRSLTTIHALGIAPLTKRGDASISTPHSVRCSIEAGVDVAIVRGDGLAGGPTCGIIVGATNAVRSISQHSMYPAWTVDPLRSAALLATLECYERAPGGLEPLPAWQLLTTPLENLRNRAERIAPQLAVAEGIQSATAIETLSPWWAGLGTDRGLPSYGIALSPADGNAEALSDRLQKLPLPIHGRGESARVVLDLRTVFPRQDAMLVESIAGVQVREPSAEAPAVAGGSAMAESASA